MSGRDPRYGTKRWALLRAEAIRVYGRRCSVAGCAADMTRRYETQVDHVVEASDGGEFWDLGNLQVLCKLHHMAKTKAVAAGRDRPSPNG